MNYPRCGGSSMIKNGCNGVKVPGLGHAFKQSA
jgi:hypothetical protein